MRSSKQPKSLFDVHPFLIGVFTILIGILFWPSNLKPPSHKDELNWTKIVNSKLRTGFKSSPFSFVGYGSDGSKNTYDAIALSFDNQLKLTELVEANTEFMLGWYNICPDWKSFNEDCLVVMSVVIRDVTVIDYQSSYNLLKLKNENLFFRFLLLIPYLIGTAFIAFSIYRSLNKVKKM